MCSNSVRVSHDALSINFYPTEGGFAAGGARSGTAAAGGTGQAGRAATISAVDGAAQGGQSGLQQIQNVYAIQIYQKAIHYGLCLEQHGHVIYGLTEAGMARARIA